MKYNYYFKVVVVGDVAVGKTSLISRFSKRKHRVEYNPTTNVEITYVNLQSSDLNIILKIWDTVGGPQDTAQLPTICSDSDSFIIVYEIDRESSFINVDKYIGQLRPYIKEGTILCLVGNKIDIAARKFSPEEAQRKASAFNMAYFETSAKEGKNVDEVFGYVLRKLLERKLNELKAKAAVSKSDDKISPREVLLKEMNESDPFTAVSNALKRIGINAELQSSCIGKSGIKHDFSLIIWPEGAEGGSKPYAVVDILAQSTAIGTKSIFEFLAKTVDIDPSRKILICIPKLNDEAKKFVTANKIEFIESYGFQEAAIKLFDMLSKSSVEGSIDKLNDEINSLGRILSQMYELSEQ